MYLKDKILQTDEKGKTKVKTQYNFWKVLTVPY